MRRCSGCIASAFGYQGQKCSALSRLVVLADNYDRFIERLIAAAASLRVGPAEEPGAMLGPVINRDCQQRILAVIAAGDRKPSSPGRELFPTMPMPAM